MAPKCQYRDFSGGDLDALLLYFASAYAPEFAPMEETEAVLTRLLQRPRAKNWPGPLAAYLLGSADEIGEIKDTFGETPPTFHPAVGPSESSVTTIVSKIIRQWAVAKRIADIGSFEPATFNKDLAGLMRVVNRFEY